MNFKTPSRGMAATITLTLLVLFAISYLAPYLSFSWLNPDVKPDAALQQNLLMLLAISVTYYIGSSKSSADNGDAIRQQLANATPTVTAGGAQVVKIDDTQPVKVEDVR